jgi:DNA-binding transcriptional ArsR family regulator
VGASKHLYFSEDQNTTAGLFKAMAHPARIAIIQHILATRSCICGDLVDVLPLSQATVSQHLKELKNAGIIKGSIDGNSICYCLNEETLKKISSFLEVLIIGNDEKKCC